METALRLSGPSLKQELAESPYLFEFCQAIRILESLEPNCYGLGVFSNPMEEVVLLKSRVAFSYPPSDLYQFVNFSKPPYVLEVNFQGIAGAGGPLPMPYTEDLIRRSQRNDHGFEQFLNIFNHRTLSLLYRIRKKHWVALETVTPEKSRLGMILLSYLGLGMPSYQNRLQVPDRSLLAYAGLVWPSTKSAMGLTTLLSDYFQTPFDLIPFEGEWIPISPQQRTYLRAGNPWRRLGQGAALGDKAYTVLRTCLLRVGPLDFSRFQSFLPWERGYKELRSIATFYMGMDKRFKLNLVLKREEVPPLVLNGKQYLGYTTWLHTRTPDKDDDQVCFQKE